MHGSFVVRNGRSNRFWEDTWLGDRSQDSQYPSLFNITQHKNVLVAEVMINGSCVKEVSDMQQVNRLGSYGPETDDGLIIK